MLSTNRWSNFYSYYMQYKDMQSASRLRELFDKVKKEELIFTFTGHYSAGKSSIINALVQDSVMPTSPIPTTANIFRIKKGNSQTKVSFPNRKVMIYLDCHDVEEVLQDIPNQDEIRELEIQLKNIPFSDNMVLMDTPGIDSTDKAHELATESSIHLADFIFYVVDYNHVQAEVNFQFTKQLRAVGKKFILVVNQMDKHREEEISLADFQDSVIQAFSSYEIDPCFIIYTSTIEGSSFFQGLNSVNAFIKNGFHNQKDLYLHSIEASFQKIYMDHVIVMTKSYEEKIASCDNKLQKLTAEEYNALEENLRSIHEQLESMERMEKEYMEMLYDEWNSIIKNAYIMPYQIREVAKAYLEVVQKNIKFGFFTSKQKVEKQKENKLAIFFEQLQEIVKVQLVLPLIHFLEKSEIKKVGETIEQLDVLVQLNRLKELVNLDAQFSENYVLVYCESIENDIKQALKKVIMPIFSKWEDERHITLNINKSELETKRKEVSHYLEIKNKKEELLTDFSEWESNLEKLFSTEEVYDDAFIKDLNDDKEDISYKSVRKIDKLVKPNKELIDKESIGKESINNDYNVDLMIEKLQVLSKEVQPLKGFSQISQQLSKKAQDITNRSYTICLFGAFSAGKSSFANALLDFPLLPVSPNPTTATINRILPVDSNHTNKTVVVKWKSEVEMLQEINDYLQLVKKEASTLEDAVQIISHSKEQPIEKYANEFRYLHAFTSGFSTNFKSLGTESYVQLEQLANYVSVEETSCFIASIDVYYDCDLTRKGITLIDTPGGDSINSRHTELSFEFMKKADCIFYVSYYNHAFAKADQSFLLQLGRLKEAFEKDKIFFVINAIDLAKNVREQTAVKQYLEEQLQSYGIHSPKILTVSSLYYNHSIYGKWMEKAKEELYQFIEHEWLALMLQSASREYADTLQLLHRLLLSVRTKKHEAKQELIRLDKEKHTILELFNFNLLSDVEIKQKREIEEQLYYVKQRIFFRLTEWIKEAFHPSVLRGENKKVEVSNASTSFLIQVNYEFEQELRVVNVRLNSFLQRFLRDIISELVKRMEEINNEMTLREEFTLLEDISIKNVAPFKQLEDQVFKLGTKFYKNPRSFFEENGRKLLTEELLKLIDEHSKLYLKELLVKMEQIYNENIQENTAVILKALKNSIDEYYEGKVALFTDEENLIMLENIVAKMNHYN